MMWLELLGVAVWQSRYIKVTSKMKAVALQELAGGCDVILHREGKRSRFICKKIGHNSRAAQHAAIELRRLLVGSIILF